MPQGIFLFLTREGQKMEENGKVHSRTDLLTLGGHQVQIWRNPKGITLQTKEGEKFIPLKSAERMVREEREKGNTSLNITIRSNTGKDLEIPITCRRLKRHIERAKQNI